MSTQYICHEMNSAYGEKLTLQVDERSSQFDVDAYCEYPGETIHVSVGPMTAEELVDAAVKMIQPALYNVEDPDRFYNEVVLPKVHALFR